MAHTSQADHASISEAIDELVSASCSMGTEYGRAVMINGSPRFSKPVVRGQRDIVRAAERKLAALCCLPDRPHRYGADANACGMSDE